MAAHRSGDGRQIAELYRQAGDEAERRGDTERACFYLVHAYVFSLQEGMELATELRDRLRFHGREI